MATRPTLRGSFGMAASTHWLASQSAMAELEAGGNAFDAAVAGRVRAARRRAAPQRAGRRGAGRVRHRRRPDTSGAVRAGHRRRPGRPGSTTSASGLELVPGSGPLAAAIPGAVDAWLMLGRDHGTRPLREVLSYAIGYARAGHQLLPAAPGPSPGSSSCSGSTGPPRRRDGCRTGGSRGRGSSSSTREHAATLERLVSGGRGRRNRPRRRSTTARGVPGARGSWPRPSTPSAGLPFRDSSGADHAGVLTGADLAGLVRVVRAARRAALPRRRGRQDRPVGPGAGAARRRWPCSTGFPTRRSTRRRPTGCTRSSRCSSSRWPIARRGSATRRRSPWPSCSTRPTSGRGGPSSATRPRP